MKFLKIKNLFLYFFITLLLVVPVSIFAADSVSSCDDTNRILPCCATSGDGDFCCALLVAQNITQWILGIIGSGALLMFVYGGFLWITSAGKSEQVKKGQSILINTILGIFVVVIAWFAVNFVISSLAGSPNIAGGTAWYEICKK